MLHNSEVYQWPSALRPIICNNNVPGSTPPSFYYAFKRSTWSFKGILQLAAERHWLKGSLWSFSTRCSLTVLLQVNVHTSTHRWSEPLAHWWCHSSFTDLQVVITVQNVWKHPNTGVEEGTHSKHGSKLCGVGHIKPNYESFGPLAIYKAVFAPDIIAACTVWCPTQICVTLW